MTSVASKVGKVLRLLLPIAILVAAGGFASDLLTSSPRAKRKPRPRNARLVEVVPVQMSRQRAQVKAMGTVKAARSLELRAMVPGQIVRLGEEFIPGGRFRTGQLIAQVDPADFELDIRERQSQLVRAQGELRLEQGRQRVAAHEAQLLSERATDGELVLRKPQLETARAAIEAAQAALERAQLDKKRARIVAPFNALVESRLVEVGAQVGTTTLLGRLVGTDAYWVEVSVPVSQLRWIAVPRSADDEGSPVEVCNDKVWGEGHCRVGRVLRRASGLEEQGRMARLLVQVEDPLALEEENAGAPELILGSYVRVEIEGSEEMDVAVIDRAALRDGDQVWIATERGVLEMRPVQVAFRSRERVHVVEGLSDGDQLITTVLAGAVDGMPIRTGDAAGARGRARAGKGGSRPEGKGGDG